MQHHNIPYPLPLNGNTVKLCSLSKLDNKQPGCPQGLHRGEIKVAKQAAVGPACSKKAPLLRSAQNSEASSKNISQRGLTWTADDKNHGSLSESDELPSLPHQLVKVHLGFTSSYVTVATTQKQISCVTIRQSQQQQQ